MSATQAQTRAGKTAPDSPALRVAGIDPELRFAGGESQVLALTLGLIRRGHQAELLCDPSGRLWERASAAGIRCHPLKIRNALDPGAGLKLRRILAAGHYDIIHFHTSRAHAMAPYARGKARAMVVTRRMDYRPNRLFAPWLYNRAVDGVAAISEAVAGALTAAGVARERITVIPSGVDCARFAPPDDPARFRARSALGLEQGEIAVGALGALEPRKGHHYLLEALALLKKDPSGATANLRCFVAGDGTLAQTLAGQTRRLDLEAMVSFPGRLDDPLGFLWALDIFVMPSLKEGLGVAALEAMACGLPVIASGVGGIRETVENGAGLLTEAGSPESLASAIKQLAAAAELRAAMAARGRARAVERYSSEANIDMTLKFYLNCLSRSPRGEE
ncbi:MAG: glycosyltransferase [Candidatus Binataceae bacterium]